MKKKLHAILIAVLSIVLSSLLLPVTAQNNALEFDGSNDYVTFGQATTTLGASSFTVECWFKRTATGTPNTTGSGGVATMVPLVTKGAPESDGNNKDANYILGIQDGGSGDSYIACDFEDTGGSPNNHPKVGTTPIIMEVWYHAAMTFDNTTKKYVLYLNGKLEGLEETLTGITPRFDSEQYAGLASMLETNNADQNGFFAGLIDEARIWNHARSQTEIQDDMGIELTSGTGLLGRWGLNDGSGSVASNSISGSPDGTLMGGSSWITGLTYPLNIITFQEGVNGYTGAIDTHIWENQGTTNYGAYDYIKWDLSSGGYTMWALLRFEDLFQSEAGPIPDNATIVGATVKYFVTDTGDGANVYEATSTWDESTVFTGFPGDPGSQGTYVTSAPGDLIDTYYALNVSASLESWSSSPALNKGWIFEQPGPDNNGVKACSKEHATISQRPELTVIYAVTDPPAAPSSLSASTTAGLQIDLSWTDNSENESAFEIEYSSDGTGGSYTALESVGANTTTYSHSSLDPEQEYCYQVRAVNAIGNSAYSNTDCATTPETPPFALDFGTGSAYVTFGDPDELDLAQFTLETWFKREGTGSTANTGNGGMLAIPLVTKGVGEAEVSSVDLNYFLGIRGSDNVLAADFEEGAGGTSPSLNHPVAGTTTIVNDTWYHAAVTYDGNKWQLFLNGQLENEITVGQPVASLSTQHAGLGVAMKSTGETYGHFDGVLDEVRIWSYARTQAEILATINDELTSGTGLVTRWGLNEGTGTSVGSTVLPAVDGTIENSGYSWVTPGAPFNIVTTPPTAPASLVVLNGSGMELDLNWADNSDNETGFEIEYSINGSGGPFVYHTTVGVDVTAYSHQSLLPDAEYCYRVRAVNGVGSSTYTNTDCGTTPAEPDFALDFDGSNDYVTFGAANGTPGSLQNTPTWDTETGLDPAPAGNNSLQFNGTNEYITFGEASELGAATFTLEVWFKWTGGGETSSSGGGGIEAIPLITKGRGEADGSILDCNYLFGITSGGFLAADFEDIDAEAIDGDKAGQNHPITGDIAVSVDEWHHAAATYDGSTWRLYLDGVLDETLDVTNSGFLPPRPQFNSVQHAALATALNSSGSPDGYFDGILDEARIWNYARSLTEIQSTMDQEIQTAPGLIGRWGMNEGGGTNTASSVNSLGLSVFTIETWFKKTGTGDKATTGGSGAGVEAIPLVTKGRGQGDGAYNNVDMNYFLGIGKARATPASDPDVLVADFEDLETSSGDNNHPIEGTTEILDNIWYHAAAIFDGSDWYLYLNGILENTVSGGGTTPTNVCIQHAGIGTAMTSTPSPDGFFEGIVDEVRIWNSARSETEIRENMHRTLENPTIETNLVGYYQCNESSGTVLTNITNANLNGILTNMDDPADWIISTAPIPYYSITNGSWNTISTWENGQLSPDRAWARIKIGHDVTLGTIQEVIDATIESTGSLSINPDFGLTVTGDLVNNSGIDGLVIQADVNGMGSLIHATSDVEGKAELYLTSDQWHYVSSPINDMHESGVFEDFYLKAFNEPDDAWGPSITELDADLITMKGYEAWLYNSNTPVTVSFEGMLNQGNQSISVTNSGGSISPGWNLVGNPYPSALDWDGAGWTKTGIDNAVYYWEGVGGDEGDGNYHYFVGDEGTAPYTGGISVGDGSQYIPSMQAFFVHAQTNTTLAVTNDARAHDNQDYYKEAAVIEYPIIRLKTENINGLTDETLIRFISESTVEHDGAYDAFKLAGYNYPQVCSTTEDGIDLAVNTLPVYDDETSIPIGFVAPEADEYSLELTEFEGFEGQVDLFLEDLQTGTIQDLIDNPIYMFMGSPEDNQARFLLRFNDAKKIDGVSENSVNIYATDQTIVVHNLRSETGIIDIFNISGKKIRTENIESGKLRRLRMNNAAGIYMVNFKTNNSRSTKKVYLR